MSSGPNTRSHGAGAPPAHSDPRVAPEVAALNARLDRLSASLGNESGPTVRDPDNPSGTMTRLPEVFTAREFQEALGGTIAEGSLRVDLLPPAEVPAEVPAEFVQRLHGQIRAWHEPNHPEIFDDIVGPQDWENEPNSPDSADSDCELTDADIEAAHLVRETLSNGGSVCLRGTWEANLSEIVRIALRNFATVHHYYAPTTKSVAFDSLRSRGDLRTVDTDDETLVLLNDPKHRYAFLNPPDEAVGWLNHADKLDPETFKTYVVTSLIANSRLVVTFTKADGDLEVLTSADQFADLL